MKKNKSVILLILLTIIMFNSNNNIVIAAENGSSADYTGGDLGGGGSSGYTYPSGDQSGTGASNSYRDSSGALIQVLPGNCSCGAGSCQTSYSITGYGYSTRWQSFDMYNNDLQGDVIAGTQLGFNLYEEKYAYWRANGTIMIECSCVSYIHVSIPCEFEDGRGTYDCGPTYPIYYPATFSSWSSACYYSNAQKAYNAAKKVVESGAYYSLTIPDPNDARCQYPEKYKEELERDGVVCDNYTSVEAIPGEVSPPLSNPVIKKYYYELYGSCINVKTGKVRYLSKNDKCNSDEYYIDKDKEQQDTRHWHIFTPLNTKSTEGYSLLLDGKSKGTKQIGKLCEITIDKYENYMDYIIPLTGNFTGNKKADKKRVANGCYMQTKIEISTTQKFYGEEINGNDSTLTGFAFYYRPIDITNPFPNGVASDSYWQEWNEKNQKDPDLSESFDEVTYETNGIDLSYIREYNDQNNYTSWLDMNINGTSTFINSSKIINRSSTLQSDNLYNLGCGPTNMCEYYLDSNGTKKKNPIYQSECANTRKGVSCP